MTSDRFLAHNYRQVLRERCAVAPSGWQIPANYTSNLIRREKTAIRVGTDGADVATSNYLLAALYARIR